MPEILGPFDQAKTVTRNRNGPAPTSLKQAVWRGMRNRCPRCDRRKFFWSYLKPILICMHCGQDWTAEQAHDFPAYLAILVTGHLMAPLMIAVIGGGQIPVVTSIVIIVTTACLLMLTLLQPAKGAVIAAQWWLGMHGFSKRPK